MKLSNKPHRNYGWPKKITYLVVSAVFIYSAYGNLNSQLERDRKSLIGQIEEKVNYYSDSLALMSKINLPLDRSSDTASKSIQNLLNRFILGEKPIAGLLLLD